MAVLVLGLKQLTQLQQAQQKLDQVIFQKHHQTRSATRSARILAFMVELAELANVHRGFKYWSHKRVVNRTLLLEEYVDALHFLLSLTIDLPSSLITWSIETHTPQDLSSFTAYIFALFTDSLLLVQQFDCVVLHKILTLFLCLGSTLGFTSVAVVDAYWKKYHINQQRQQEQY